MAEPTISIRADKPTDAAACQDLLNWLLADQYVKANAQLSAKSNEKGDMGATIAAIQLVLNSGFELAKLVMAILDWRRQSKKTAPITVQVGRMRTVLSLADLADEKIVLRTLGGAPDPRRSRCVLIGISDYAQLQQLPAVQQNLSRLEEVLTDPAIWGIPSERLRKIDYPRSADEIRDAISSAAADAPDALLIYYAGHGLRDEQRRLLLALPEATEDGRSGTVLWNDLAEVIHQASADRRVVLLDCCYGGLALENRESSPDLLGAARAGGAYMLAAAHDEARSPDGEDCTAFTGELVRVLRNGVPSGPRPQEFLSLNRIHQEVRSALESSHYPNPQRHDPGSIGQLPHFGNLARNERSPQAPQSPGPPAAAPGPHLPGPHLPRRHLPGLHLPNRNYRDLASAVAGALLSLLIIWLVSVFSTPSTSLGGLDLSVYCGNMNPSPTSNGDIYCTRPADLQAACKRQYQDQGTGITFTISPANPYSAKCKDSAGVYLGGINDMTGYCRDATGMKGAEAIPTTSGSEWVCQEKVDLNVACIWEYREPGLQAREVSSGIWNCYG